MWIYDVVGNQQWLDGGAMFGNVPRAVWSRWYPPDELGRIQLACRCALVRLGARWILLETGIGSFFEPKSRERYGVLEQEHVLLHSLAARGLTHADIDVVVLSHLHFDHAGGLLAPYEHGAPARLLFPNAQFVVGKAALERAKHPHPRDRASFIAELVPLLEASGRLSWVEEGQAHHPALGPDVELSTSQGHTPGLLHTWLRGSQKNVFFCSDLVPGRAWVHLPVSMGYDRSPETLIDEKAALFPRLEREKTWLFFTHDPEVALARLTRDESGRYAPTQATQTLPSGLDLDAPDD
jgi:glyoxylase-like metal-dependent hydrolase (beta-lactamase superfamily II)